MGFPLPVMARRVYKNWFQSPRFLDGSPRPEELVSKGEQSRSPTPHDMLGYKNDYYNYYTRTKDTSA